MAIPPASKTINWTPVQNWTKVILVGLDDSPGLLKFSRDGEIVYIGMETQSVANFRRFVTPGGSWKSHAGGRLVHEHRFSLRLKYAIVESTSEEIEHLRDRLIDKHKPPFNFPDHNPRKD